MVFDMKIRHYIFSVIFCISYLVHQVINADEIYYMTDNLKQDLQTLSKARIYFGHMSVGGNIISGLESILAENRDIKLNIIERNPGKTLPDKFLLHSSIGKNTDPLSKCIDFKNIIELELKDKINYAMFKFCYIDISENTNIDELFVKYKKTMDKLVSTYSEIQFIHVTVPLQHIVSGPSVWIRELLGQPNNTKLANIKRNQFNELLRENYKNQPLFDLASFESIHPNGSKEIFHYKSNTKYQGLIDNYTDDGRHLNDFGKRKIAGDFISQLAKIISSNEQ